MSDFAFNGSQWKNQFKQGIGLRILILKTLETNFHPKNPLTAYEIQSEISKITLSFWKPSPGSIYPILSELSGKRFVTVEKRENKDYYSLTKEGKDIFNKILSFKLMADLFMSTRLYDNFDLNSIQIPTDIPQFKQQIHQMVSMVGTFAEQEGIDLDRIQEQLTGIEKEFQKEKIRDFIKGIDQYGHIIKAFQEKFREQLNKFNSTTNS